jgi:hypothetical protein
MLLTHVPEFAVPIAEVMNCEVLVKVVFEPPAVGAATIVPVRREVALTVNVSSVVRNVLTALASLTVATNLPFAVEPAAAVAVGAVRETLVGAPATTSENVVATFPEAGADSDVVEVVFTHTRNVYVPGTKTLLPSVAMLTLTELYAEEEPDANVAAFVATTPATAFTVGADSNL